MKKTPQSILTIPGQAKSSSAIPDQDENQYQDQDGLETYETFFNPLDEIRTYEAKLPHWRQENVWYFVTFRLGDSIPKTLAEQIRTERATWWKKNGKTLKSSFTREQRIEYYRLFSERIENLLNAGMGSCVMKHPKIAKMVADAVLHFNHERYLLDEWVVMPNHVHTLVKPLRGNELTDILHSWKSFTGNKINETLGKKGQLWMHESYDHIVRNKKAFEAIKNYIRFNPEKAGLKPANYLRSFDQNNL